MPKDKVMVLLLQYAEALGAARAELLHIAMTCDDPVSRGNASRVYDQTGEVIRIGTIPHS